MQSEGALTGELLEGVDQVMVTTAHTGVDYRLVQRCAKVVFDTKNAMKHIKSRDDIEVL